MRMNVRHKAMHQGMIPILFTILTSGLIVYVVKHGWSPVHILETLPMLSLTCHINDLAVV